jgi:hypothetical protein
MEKMLGNTGLEGWIEENNKNVRTVRDPGAWSFQMWTKSANHYMSDILIAHKYKAQNGAPVF